MDTMHWLVWGQVLVDGGSGWRSCEVELALYLWYLSANRAMLVSLNYLRL